MRPYLLKGHERPLTQLKYNREGDLLFSCAKDHHPNLWYSDNGTRVGTYVGHNGAVWTCDVSWDSVLLITGSADSSARLWDVSTGKTILTYQFTQPCRAVKFSVGDKMAAISADPFMATSSAIYLVAVPDEENQDVDLKPFQTLQGPKGKTNRVEWIDANKTLLTVGEDGCARHWDVETGKIVLEKQIHEKPIQDMQMATDLTHFATASIDKTAKLIDTVTLEVLKEYQTERPCNSAAISPIFDHLLIGGGQDASQVTTTSARAGKFESRFFHKIYQEEFASVRGHFGPINAVAYHPDGKSFASGGEDGYVRLHHFDSDYFTTKWFPDVEV